jgi:CMP-2-keto-3-deoxyoctulosonic acid synthetase
MTQNLSVKHAYSSLKNVDLSVQLRLLPAGLVIHISMSTACNPSSIDISKRLMQFHNITCTLF